MKTKYQYQTIQFDLVITLQLIVSLRFRSITHQKRLDRFSAFCPHTARTSNAKRPSHPHVDRIRSSPRCIHKSILSKYRNSVLWDSIFLCSANHVLEFNQESVSSLPRDARLMQHRVQGDTFGPP